MTDVLLEIVAVLLAALVVLQIVYLVERRKWGKQLKSGNADFPTAGKKASANGTVPASRRSGPKTAPAKAAKTSRKKGLLAWFGRHKPEEPPEEEQPPVVLQAAASGAVEAERLYRASELPGFRDARWMLTEALQRRSQLMTLNCRPEKIAVRHRVDTLWHEGHPWEGEPGRAAVEVFKTLCGLGADNGPAQQRGQFAATFESTRYEVTLAKQWTSGGERLALQFASSSPPLRTLTDLGLRPQLQDRLGEVLNGGSGILLLSAMPEMGLRTMTEAVLHGIDRLQREAIAVEEETRRYPPVECMEVKTYSDARGESPDFVFPEVFDLDPSVVVLRDLPDGPTFDSLCQYLDRHKCLAILTIRAAHCVDTLAQVIATGVNQTLLARHLTAVLNQRLIRKLCTDCKQPFTPPAETLASLGIATETAIQFHRPPRTREKTCPHCGDLGYRGRTGLFELLVADDAFRRVLASKPSGKSLQTAARVTGMRTLLQEGFHMAAEGFTSLDEVSRVMAPVRAAPRETAKPPAGAGV